MARRRNRRQNNNPQSKNARRVVAAENALARVVPKPKKTVPRLFSVFTGDRNGAHVMRYIESLLHDKLVPDLDLPSFGSTRPYARTYHYTRGSFTAGAGVQASIIANPRMLWTDELHLQRITGSALVDQAIPTLAVNTTTTAASSYAAGANQSAQNMTNQYPSSSAQSFAGFVRPHGVRFRVLYTGTELNKGGHLVAIHNATNTSLLYNDPAITAAGTTPTAASLDAAGLQNQAELSSSHHLGDSFEFVWRPSQPEFSAIQSGIDDTILTGVTAGENPRLETMGYLSNDGARCAEMVNGWLTGLYIAPAAGTAATALPYIWEVEAVYDISLHAQEDNTTSVRAATAFGSTKKPLAHPVHEAMIRNALAYVHTKRSTKNIPFYARSLSLANEAARGAAKAFKGAAADAMVEKLGTSIGAAFA